MSIEVEYLEHWKTPERNTSKTIIVKALIDNLGFNKRRVIKQIPIGEIIFVPRKQRINHEKFYFRAEVDKYMAKFWPERQWPVASHHFPTLLLGTFPTKQEAKDVIIAYEKIFDVN